MTITTATITFNQGVRGMKHKHYDLIVEWAKDTSREVEYKDDDGSWRRAIFNNWNEDLEYRLKPKKKEVVSKLIRRNI